ncbi:MAG TPA: hypothetical protein VMT34_11925 [Aggregatilineales bacterium]|nr:hypothetical protein [Aggregatilineales bacterium]
MNNPIICPQCGRDDMAQKVTGIYETGTATGAFQGRTRPLLGLLPDGVQNLSGSTQTLLSRKLTPPPRPAKTSERLLLLVIVGMIMLVVSEGLLVLVGLLLKFPSLGIGFLGLLVGFLIVGGTVLATLVYTRNHQHTIKAWQDAIAIWERLYYCSRNDCIFDPLTRQSVPTDRMDLLLYGRPKPR